MNTAELNITALVTAASALLGTEKANVLSELYTLLDNAEKIGFADGEKSVERAAQRGYEAAYSDRLTDTRHEGYKNGYADGMENCSAESYDIGYDDGFADGVADAETYGKDMYDAGYEQRGDDMGECPIVDQEWDVDGEGYLRRAVTAMMD
jgi:hypothetical protein